MIVTDATRNLHEAWGCEGILLIGDPHVGSVRPGRRNDPDWPMPILRKLERSIAVANERGLRPVFLGDMFDSPIEADEGLKTKLIRILKGSRLIPLCNVGNHDKANRMLSDEDSLCALGVADVLDVVVDGGPAMVLEVGGRTVGIGMTPYDQTIPNDVRGAFDGRDVDEVLWCTHHDVAFANTYAGTMAPFAIQGCDTVVNGHIHLTKDPIKVGRTTWFNVGNINRQSVDLRDHAPHVHVYPRGQGAPRYRFQPFEGIGLDHSRDVFDMTGRAVRPASADEVAETVRSAFVDLLKAEESTDIVRSGDGSVIRESIDAKYAEDGTTDGVRAIVDDLHREAVRALAQAA